ncbi:MAG: cytochrome c oxidase assembly protein [Acidimicrobiales bacterium]|nr:cytochrome c oxidase assembly protein [Acidimicrobiales bacterium]RZV44940.1 MAG: cytochrome c oxidase assembly protein [Acidimicrobiales bacterium]
MFAAVDAWSWRPHPEVWVLLAGIIGLGYYAVHIIAPKVVSEGEIVSRRQKKFFVAGVITLAIAADWPMHDIAEEYLYSVHMSQHLLITFFIPILFLQATPEWLARLIIGSDSQASSVLRRLSKPIVAGVIFNIFAALTHWNGVVQASFDSGPFHYGIHLAMFASALLMWLPVLGPLPELRLSVPAQMVYLFCMSIIPTVPAGWLTFADNVVYPAYDTPDRLFGLSAVDDQQLAGFIMKVLGGFFLWVLMGIRYFKWAGENRKAEMEMRVQRSQARLAEAEKTLPKQDPLTFEDVADEFEKSAPSRIEG